jgi:spermidine synthase
MPILPQSSPFLAGADIDGIELDPAVVAAATHAMGLPGDLPALDVHTADAAAFLRERVAQLGKSGDQQALYDLIVMDTFDGEDNVPATLCTAGNQGELY